MQIAFYGEAVDTVARVCLHRRVKILALVLLCVASSSCITLENRRDLYSSDPEVYWRPMPGTPTRSTTTTTTTTTSAVTPAGTVRTVGPEMEEVPAQPLPAR